MNVYGRGKIMVLRFGKRRAANLSMIVFAAVGCVLLGGCMVGPDYSRPETAAGPAESFVNAPDGWGDVGGNVGRWWERFGDDVTAELVLAALANNNDLKAAAARLERAEALLAQSSGARLPGLSYSASRTRSKNSFNFGGIGRFSSMTTTYAQDLNISYIVDFFGKLKRAERAAVDDLLAAEASRDVMTNTIIAQVVNSRIRIAILQRQLGITLATIESRTVTLEVTERRYESGRASPLEVHQARENLAASQSVEPSLRRSLALARHSLDVLTGQRPGTSEEPADNLGALPKLDAVPLGLPVSLLDRRPDVRQAEMRLAAATERVGVSIAEMFPDLTLTGSGGYRSDTFRMLTASEGEVWTAVMGLAAPIYKGGSLKAAVRAAKASVKQAGAEYAGVVLTALREVEDALVSERMLQQKLGLLEVRLKEAKSAEALALQRYSQGLETMLTVLDTQRRSIIAENEFVITQGDLWTARVNLFLAIGGDWVAEEEAAVVESKD